MLSSMHIENIAVIRRLDIDFASGFTAVTGETGAGKSIVIDSIRLLLGAKASREFIRTGEDCANVSALFCDIGAGVSARLMEIGASPDENGELLLYRSISSDGRSSAKINGRSVPLSLLREAGSMLVSIYGQHDSVALLDEANHIGLLDSFACDEALIDDYKAVYAKIGETTRALRALLKDTREKERMTQMLSFQIKEIDEAKLKKGEDEVLEANKLKIKNAEKLFRQSKTVYRALFANEKGTSASALIEIARNSLESMAGVFPELNSDVERLDAVRFELEGIAEKAQGYADTGVDDPIKALDEIESRLDKIEKLKKKYGDSVEEILAERDKYARQLEELENSDQLEGEYQAALAKLYDQAIAKAEKINEARRKAAANLEDGIMRELAYLDLEKVKFKVDFRRSLTESNKVKLLPNGTDEVEFLISTNTGEPLKSMAKIASGGELSRIMLAIKVVFAGKEGTPTLIFDEIDTGISGKTSQKIGFKLDEISSFTQIFCVTHSAQTASVASSHIKVSKSDVAGRTETSVKELIGDERVEEIARIMGGVQLTDKIRESARELLNWKNNKNI